MLDKKEQVVEKAKSINQQVNIGYLFGKKLKDNLNHVEAKNVLSPKKKKSLNGKVGINKNSNYTPNKHVPRKVCLKCGSSNHLAIQCKNVVHSVFSKSVPTNVNQNLGNFPQIPFLHNLFYLYGNASMTLMLWGNQTVNNPFAYTYPENESKVYLHPKGSNKPKGQRATPKMKVDLTSPESKVEKLVSKSKASSNKPGPKAIWVPIQK